MGSGADPTIAGRRTDNSAGRIPMSDALFWWSLAVSLAIAFVSAFPVNRYLIARGRGHAVVHAYH